MIVVAMFAIVANVFAAVTFELSPAGGLTFSDEVGGTPSASHQLVTLRNSGDETLDSIVVSAADASRFPVVSHCGSSLGPSESCTIDVSFDAAARGSVNSTLSVTSNGATQSIPLSGTGTAPAASVAPSSLGFSATAGTSSVPQTVTMTNNGDAPLMIRNVALGGANPGRFSIANRCTSRVPAGGGHCTVDVTFNPTAAGESTATLTFTDNAPGSPHSVALSGTGTPPPVAPTAAPAPPPPLPPAGAQTDRDNDGVPDASDSCAATAGNLRNGCPSELNADIRGSWRVNTLMSQLLALTVRARVGSRIEIRCSGKKRVCAFRTKAIKRTTRRTTNLTSYFKGRRILPAGTVIVVRVTRPLQRGTYERLQTRRGRKLPKVLNRCLSAATAKVQPCADD